MAMAQDRRRGDSSRRSRRDSRRAARAGGGGRSGGSRDGGGRRREGYGYREKDRRRRSRSASGGRDRGGDRGRGRDDSRRRDRGGDRRDGERGGDRGRRREEPAKHRRRDSRSRSRSQRKRKAAAKSSDYSSSSGSSSDKQEDGASGSGADTDQDEIIHFDWRRGMRLNNRYDLTRLMGDGTFGRVVAASDRRNDGKEVAVKIIRDVKKYMENAKIEADILENIRKKDPDKTSGCCLMYDTFIHEAKFFCLVFEPLGVSLYDFLKDNGFRGFWMQDVQEFARQSLEALSFLHDRLKMTHTDLKPENILLVTREPPRTTNFPRQQWQESRGPSSKQCQPSVPYRRPVTSEIKIIDFGNATYDSEHHSSIINTRQYRGPEILLSLGWNEVSDQWSIGCILMELYAGEQLFATHEELEHLALMEQILGSIPAHMLEKASASSQTSKWLAQTSQGLRLNWPKGAAGKSSEQHVSDQRRLPEQVMDQHRSFTSFITALLTLDPRLRPSAAESLRHAFFRDRFDD